MQSYNFLAIYRYLLYIFHEIFYHFVEPIKIEQYNKKNKTERKKEKRCMMILIPRKTYFCDILLNSL